MLARGLKITDISLFTGLTVVWENGARKETYILFSLSGFTEKLRAIAKERGDLMLFERRITEDLT